MRIVVMVPQEEIQEVQNNAFYLDWEVADISPDGRIREPAVRHTGAKPPANNVEPRRKSSQTGQRRPGKLASSSNAQAGDTVHCYEYSGYGHYARDCAIRSQWQADS